VNTETLTQLDRVILEAYRAPLGERALLKWVPIGELDTVRTIFRTLGVRVRVRYRGPRRDSMRLTTLKRHARAFTVYPVAEAV